MGDYKPKVGDRVRMVFEGTYTSDGPGVDVGRGAYFYEDHAMAAAKSIEKIEPPVVTFKPGDVVRENNTGIIRFLSDQGYIRPDLNGKFFPWVAGYYGSIDELTSEFHEKIDL